MREYKTEEVTHKHEKLIKIVCDWCGKEIDFGYPFDVREFVLEFLLGKSYPDGGWKAGWEVQDLCDPCVAKLRNLLADAGIAIKGVEIDW